MTRAAPATSTTPALLKRQTIQNVARTRLATLRSRGAQAEARGEEFVVPLVAREGSPEQIERDLEAPAEELEQMCLAIVEAAVRDALARAATALH